jgi:predicted transcriptional regulator
MLAAVCTRPVVTIEARASVREAARLMRQKRVGALVVATGRKPKGIITDRDIAVAVVAEGLDPSQVPVGDVMRSKPAVIREDKGIQDALRLLDAEAVRRLPVVDSRGNLTGIIALDDVLMLLGTEMGHVAAALSRSLGRPTTA